MYRYENKWFGTFRDTYIFQRALHAFALQYMDGDFAGALAAPHLKLH